MSFDSLLSMSVTVRHFVQGAEDEYHNQKLALYSTHVYRGYIEQANARGRAGATRETFGAFDVRSSDWIVVLPKDAVIGSLDKVEVAGISYDVVGQPWPVERPGHGTHHIEANLRVIEGD